MTRRESLRYLLSGGLGALAAGAVLSLRRHRGRSRERSPGSAPIPTGASYLAVTRGPSPAANTRAAIRALGGIERFVRPGHEVVIKPNVCNSYHGYEFATTTNPEVMAALVQLCVGAGARRVRVMDKPLTGSAEAAYARSGIGEAVVAAGGQLETLRPMKYRSVPIPDGRDITEWPVYGDVLDADVLINVPIAKHHFLARLTLGMKNLMGVILNANQFHLNLSRRIADLASAVRPTLTVVDATRILVAHGPTGGSLNDVKKTDTVIASHDLVAADSFAATLFDLTAADLPAIRAAAQMGLGTSDLASIKLEELSVGA